MNSQISALTLHPQILHQSPAFEPWLKISTFGRQALTTICHEHHIIKQNREKHKPDAGFAAFDGFAQAVEALAAIYVGDTAVGARILDAENVAQHQFIKQVCV